MAGGIVNGLMLGALRGAPGQRIVDRPHMLLMLDMTSGFANACIEGGGFQNEFKRRRLARLLQDAAEEYYWATDFQLGKKRRRGRPSKTADVRFAAAMAAPFTIWHGSPQFAWRRYYRGVGEQPTSFQVFCNLWLGWIDPKRADEISPATFKKAKAYRKQRGR